MQAALEIATGASLPMLWKRDADRQYMMRSEKRPISQPPRRSRRDHRNRKRRKPSRGIGFSILTVLLLIFLWPIGLFPLWTRRLRWNGGVKFVVMVMTCVVFLAGFAMFVTMPIQNKTVAAVQDGARTSLIHIAEGVDRVYKDSSKISANSARISAAASSLGRKLAVTLLPAAQDNVEAAVSSAGRLMLGLAKSGMDGINEQRMRFGLAPTPSPTPTPVPTPTPSPTPSPTPTPEPTPSVEMVWRVPGDTVYHNDPTCGGMTGAQEITLDEAVSEGLMPCERCVLNITDAASATAGAETPTVTITQEPEGDSAQPKSADASAISAEDASQTDPGASASQVSALITPSPAPLETPAVQVEITETEQPETVQTLPLPTAKPIGDVLVWHTDHGKYYHMTENCSGMKGASLHTLSSSVEAGFTPCPKCNPPAAELLSESFVVYCGSDHLFHITDECTALSAGWTAMTFEQALLEEGYSGCEECGANLYELQAKTPTKTPAPAEPPVDSED